MTRTKAIIFDMDGTLIDSEPLHLLAYQSLLSRYGHSWTEQDNREFLGRTDLIVCAAMIERFNMDTSPADLVALKEERLVELLREKSEPRRGVLETLEKASQLGIPMAVASSATLPTIEFVVGALQIRSYFRVLASGEEVPESKPAPDVFLLAAKRLEVEPRNCVVIEDTLNGIKAAKAAGMLCIAVPCDATAYQDHSQADVIYESMERFDVARWAASGLL